MIAIGLLLLAVSAPLLYAHYREYALAEEARKRYAIRQIPLEASGFADEGFVYEFRGNRIVIGDEAEPAEERRSGPVRVTVNGRDHSHPAHAIIRPEHRDPNRYHGFVALAELTDRKADTVRLAVIQRISGPKNEMPPEELRWRILLVSGDGSVEAEEFGCAERTRPLYRTRLANFATPIAIGFESNALTVWPSLFYPVLYPYVSALAGMTLALSGAGGLFLLRRVLGKPAT